jgi:hypothetical protein
MKRKLLLFLTGSFFALSIVVGATLVAAKVRPVNDARYWSNVKIWVEPAKLATGKENKTKQLYFSKDGVSFLCFTAEDNNVVSMSLLGYEGKQVLKMYSCGNSQQWDRVEYAIEGDSNRPNPEVLTDFNFDGQFDYKAIKVTGDRKREYLYFDNRWKEK